MINVREKIAVIFASCHSRSFSPPSLCAAGLERGRPALRRSYRLALRDSGAAMPLNRLLRENFYLLERERMTAVRELRGFSRLDRVLFTDGRPALCRIFAAFFSGKGGHRVTEELLEEVMSAAGEFMELSSAELCFMPAALRMTLIKCAESAFLRADDSSPDDVRYAARALHDMALVDFAALAEAVSPSERVLAQDPAGIYPVMDDDSRAYYRRLLAARARREDKSEAGAARELLEDARNGSDERERHIGYHLMKERRTYKARGVLALALPPVLAGVLCVLAGIWLRSAAVGIFAFLPLWETIKGFAEWLLMLKVPAAVIPAVDLGRAGCGDCGTVVVVSTLMPKVQDAPKLAEHLRQMYLANELPGLHFCVLADHKESASPVQADDGAKFAALSRAIAGLNAEFEGAFSAFVRERSYSRTQESYCGRERKRGAITELAGYIAGRGAPGCRIVPDGGGLRGKKRMIVLDADTNLLFDTAAKLIGAAMHPLNLPVIDPVKRVVTEGCGVIVPKMSVGLDSAGRTLFARLMAGCGGVTPYELRAKELYQDAFGASLFCGKGIIDVGAFLEVMDGRLPGERVLSHDVVEGEYLRTAFLSGVELEEGFPADPASWHARLHRWIRGDWQNIFLLARRELSVLARYKLFDNLRRELTPVLSLMCIAVSAALAFSGERSAANALAVAAVLPSAAMPLVSAVISLIDGGLFVLTRRYFSDIIPKAAESLLRALLTFVLLPVTAAVSADAVIRALWRSLVSKKRLLQWVTAADSAGDGGFAGYIRRYSFPALLGAALMFTPLPLLRLYGVLFLLTLPAAALTARKRGGQTMRLTESEREYIQGCAARMWRFFEEYAGRRDNWLPPDNVQQAPVYAVAHRTSPTNIGLGMLCVLAARDFDLIDSPELSRRLERMVSSAERLKKWHGNLYNWYDTRTLGVLCPEYVSAVDSGNFVCCLVALGEGLREYEAEAPEIAPLIGRIKRLASGAELERFYNPKRRLFSIGFDPASGEFSPSFYDFLMSEARMTSYYAIAARRVEKRHWAALSRTMSRSGGYAGPVSWTGTMFEYYMPALLLPNRDGSLLSEGLRYSYYCQRRRVRKGMPWGISESAFYSFDRQLCYQYKAHGVQKLGVKRGLDSELVISPYSSFLTLPFYPGSSIKNLRLLQREGMCGECGFFEAMDLTPGREGICRSYMSHHIGMSMIACANAAFGGVMQRRFMSDARMASAAELLEERPDRDTVVFDDVKYRDVGEIRSTNRGTKGGSAKMNAEVLEGAAEPDSPNVTILSNGELCDILSDTGENRLTLAQADLTRRTSDSLRAPQGIFVLASSGGSTFSLTEAPFYEKNVRYGAQIGRDRMKYLCQTGELSCSVEVALHDTLAVEQRTISVKNLSASKRDVELLIYFEPVLRPHRDHEAHPAFSKLFVRAHRDPESGCVVFSRRARGDERALSMAAGFLEDVEYELETRRERIFSAPEGLAALKSFVTAPFEGGSGVPDCCFAAKLRITLAPGARVSYTLCISAGSSRESCVADIVGLRRSGGIRPGRNAALSPVFNDTLEGRLAFALLPRLIYPVCGKETGRLAALNTLGIDGLWGLSISGDFPVVGCRAGGEMVRALERLRACVKALRLLRERRVEFDLAVTFSSAALPGFMESALAAIGELGCSELVNARAGIFLIDTDGVSAEQLTLLKLSTICNVDDNIYKEEFKRGFERPQELLPVAPADIEKVDAKLRVYGGAFTQKRFYSGRSTPLPYCHVLASQTFGTIVSDSSLGFSWAVNSRENKLTPWDNDFAADNRGELMALRLGERIYDLAHGALFSCAPSGARWEGHINGLKTRMDVSLPEKGAGHFKAIDVTLENTSGTEKAAELAFYTEPVLGSVGGGRYIRVFEDRGVLLLQNPMNALIPGYMALSCSAECRTLLDRAAFFAGDWERSERGGELCAALILPLKLPPKREIKVRFILTFAKEAQAAKLLAQESGALVSKPFAPPASIEIFTPDEQLDAFINGWCLHQARAGRIFARTSFWQNGGAYGFRDQLQDACCLAPFDPVLLRRQIFRACAVQFSQGDVLHWWHRYPGCVRGVRTRISDDLLWLPFAVCEYLEKTGDHSVLDARIAYLEGEELADGERERYFEPARGSERESVYHHCLRAIERARRFGPHGLPLIGSGDWNDSFSSVGALGRGESVWLAMFLYIVAVRFAKAAKKHGCEYDAAELETLAQELKQSVERHCWDGEWYLRAFFDDGEPMGSRRSAECRIDSLAQSFAALSDIDSDRARINVALDRAAEALTDKKQRTVRLFDPPFEDSLQNPGYVKAYPPGIRENGGQYTHAAIWLAMAMFERGRTGEGCRILDFLNPVSRCADYGLSRKYMLEPYYIAADIYAGECAGRGGWSLYTGAAGWYLKAVCERMLGLRVREGRLYIEPALPESWNGFSAKLTFGGAVTDISVMRTGINCLEVDGKAAEYVPLDGRNRSVRVQTE